MCRRTVPVSHRDGLGASAVEADGRGGAGADRRAHRLVLAVRGRIPSPPAAAIVGRGCRARALTRRQCQTSRWTGWRAWWSSPRLALAMSAATVLLVTQGATLWQFAGIRRENAQLETQLAEHKTALSSTQNSLAALQQELERTTATQGELQQRLAQLSTPQLDVAIVDLEPQFGGVVRGGSEPRIVTIAPNAPTITLILNFSPLASRATIEVEIADEGGQVRWTGRTQREAGTSTLTLALPSADYPTGEYLIRLFDVTRGRTSLAAYPVVIRHAPERSR